MITIHPDFRILAINRDLLEERIPAEKIRAAIEDVKRAIGPHRKGRLFGIAVEKSPLALFLAFGILESGNAFIFIPCDTAAYVEVMVKRFKVNWLLKTEGSDDVDRFNVIGTRVYMQRCSNFKMPWKTPIAYAIQTSGTMGKPKTVHVPWECIHANIVDFKNRFNLTMHDSILQLTSLTFDPSMVEILLAAETGAVLFLCTEQAGFPTFSSQPALLTSVLDKLRPTFLQLTPSCLAQLKRETLTVMLGPRSTVRHLLLGGEVFPLNLIKSVRSEDNPTKVFNVYGVTEVSCWASVQEIGIREQQAHAGEPIASTELEIVNGEVVLKGGRYCFINFQLEKGIPHRTGDLGALSDGKIVVTGRHKPNAILPSTEVEDFVLREFKEVLLAKVLFDGNFAILFYKTDAEESLNLTITDAITANLPEIKRPGLVCKVVDWPMTKNGKVDEQVLLAEAWKRIQIGSAESVAQTLLDYGISLPKDQNATFHSMGFTSLRATELLFKLDPLIKKEERGEAHRLLLSAEGTVSEFTKYLTYNTDVELAASSGTTVELQINEIVDEPKLLWDANLKKCIDASPVLVNGHIFIGSHAGIFKAHDLNTGQMLLQMDLGQRIEKRCGVGAKHVAFGTYMGSMYVMDKISRDLVAVFKLGKEVIKCVPVFNACDEIFCGSHDHSFVKLNINNKEIAFRTFLNGAVQSTPLLLEEGSIAVATMKGSVYLIGQAEGEIEAVTNLAAPIFAPIVAYDAQSFIVTTVLGTVVLFSRDLSQKSRIDLGTHHYDAPRIVSPTQLVSCGHKGRIYVIGFDGMNFSLQRTVVWSDAILVKAPLLIADVFVFSSSQGAVITMKKADLLGSTDLKAQKMLQLKGESFGSPLIVEAEGGYKLVIGSRDNFLRCFHVAKL